MALTGKPLILNTLYSLLIFESTYTYRLQG